MVRVIEDTFGEAINPLTKQVEQIKRFTISNDMQMKVQVSVFLLLLLLGMGRWDVYRHADVRTDKVQNISLFCRRGWWSNTVLDGLTAVSHSVFKVFCYCLPFCFY